MPVAPAAGVVGIGGAMVPMDGAGVSSDPQAVIRSASAKMASTPTIIRVRFIKRGNPNFTDQLSGNAACAAASRATEGQADHVVEFRLVA
jgi:hypothetical protein